MKRTIIAAILLPLWLALLGSGHAGAAYAQTTEANAQNVQSAAPNAGAIPGRLSSEQMKAIIAAADEDNHRAFSDLVQQTSAVPRALLSIQEGIRQKYPRMLGTDNCRGGTSELQRRLGRSLTPKQTDDIVEMNRVLMGCAGQYSEFAPPDARNLWGPVYQALDNEKQSQQQIEDLRNAILEVEGALDKFELGRANQLFQGLARVSPLPPFAQSYLQQTQSLRQDLDSYSQVDQIIYRQQSVSLSQQLQSLSREYSLLNEYGSKRPLTQAYLQRAIKNGVDASKQQLANLPDFQFDEASYLIPTAISQSDELALLARDIKTIDESLAQVSEVRAVVAQPELLKTAEDLVGDSEAAALKATADQIGTAERVRASLADTQNSLQTKIAAEKRLQDEQQARKQAQAARAAQMEAQKRAEEQRERRIAETQEAETKKAADEASDAEGCNLLATNKMGVSAQAREEYAEQATQKAAEKMGPDVIYNTAAGDNNRYLLMAAPPEHEGELNGYALAMANSRNIRATLCMEGFSEVQFIVRYSDGYSQKVVRRVRLSLHETMRYALQTSGARPEP